MESQKGGRSILSDFLHYDQRQQQMEQKLANSQQLPNRLIRGRPNGPRHLKKKNQAAYMEHVN